MSWNTFLRKNYLKIKRLGIDLRGLNTVKFMKGESFPHRFVKFLICHALFKRGHRFKTEQQIDNAICDVIDLDNLVIYEVETNSNPSTMRRKLEDFYHPFIEDIIIVSLKSLNFDWRTLSEICEQIEKYYGLIR